MTLDIIKRSVPVYKQIAAHYQDQIAKGILSPGDAIPNTLDLAKQFKVANQTAQNALKELSTRGLITRVPKRGSFVSEHLHANTMAIVCGRSLISEPDTGSYAQIAWQLSNHLSRQGWNAKVYTPVSQPLERLMIEDLERDIRAGLIKSVLVANMSSQLGPWLKSHCTIPWTTTNGPVEKKACSPMYCLMLEQGLEYLKQQGYHRIGIVVSHFSRLMVQGLADQVKQLQEQGKEVGEIEFICPENNAPKSGMDTIMDRIASQDPMPEVMFVMDDNLTSGILMALMASHLTYPEKIGVLTHANKGMEIISPVPLTRIEMDPVRIAINCTDNFLRKLKGEAQKDFQCLPQLVVGKSCGE